jgi:DedD protein
MAFFKFRSSDPEAQAPAPAVEGLDLLRQRARHRLIGAAVLVLVGIVGFPMVFDSQPRPVALDLPIDIPDKAKPYVLPPAVVAPADVVLNPAATSIPSKDVAIDKEVVLSTSKPVNKAVEKSVENSGDKPVDKTLDKGADKDQGMVQETAASDEAKKARTLLETAAAQGARFVVQAGVFPDAGAARDARAKLERAGMKTYTHVADTKDGKRTRVRVGPVATLAEADKLAERIRKLDLPAQVLAL